MDKEIDKELLEDVETFVGERTIALKLSMVLLIEELANADVESAMNTLKHLCVGYAYTYTEYRKEQEDAVNKLFFGNKEK